MMAEMQLASIPGNRPGSVIYHQYDGYYYHLTVNTNNASYFKCHKYGRMCQGRAIFDYIDGLRVTALHSCTRDLEFWRVCELRKRILDRCEEYPYETFRTIVHDEGRRFLLSVRARINPNNMRHAMRRVRLKRYPAIPDSLQELGDLLSEPQYYFLTETEDEGDNLFATFLVASDGSRHIIFISEGMCEVLGLVTWLFGDGHFASRPTQPPSSQIFNLVTVINHHTVWLGCVLMERRTQAAYVAVFTALRTLIPNLYPEVIMCDFERAQINAWILVFPGVLIIDCLWHFCRAIIKKAISLGMGAWFRQSRRVRRYLRMVCILPLLPEEFLFHGLFKISIECWRHGQFMFDLFCPLSDYVYQKWISDPVRRRVMCVFDSVHRTNNACETVNRWMKFEMGTVHPNVFSYLGGLVRIDGISKATVLALNQGLQPSRARKTSALSNDDRIKVLSRTLLRRPLGIRHAVRNFL